MRQDEFKKHPLWSLLEIHTSELADFIKQRREEQALLRANESNQQMGHMPGQSIYSNQQKDPNQRFIVTKEWSNAPKGFEDSQEQRAQLIVRMIAKEKLALKRAEDAQNQNYDDAVEDEDQNKKEEAHSKTEVE